MDEKLVLLVTAIPCLHFTGSFDASAADHLPTTGDDVDIPAGLKFIYDLGPDAFKIPALPGMDAAKTSVKNNLRLHSVGVEGSLTFQPNADLLMYFETMVVAPTGALTIKQDPDHTVRLVIAAPDWSNFSLAQPFDTSLDPFEFARGLVSHGAVNMQGEDVTPFITLPQLTRKENNIAPPNADGSSTFFAQVQVAVLQSSDLFAPPTAIKTVGGLQYDHVPPKDPSGQPYTNADGIVAFGVQIANLTRNINIQSEDPYHTMARGHTMFMHNANVNIAGVGFLGLGRTDKRTVVDDVQFYTKEIIDSLNQAAALQTPPGPKIPDSMIGQFIPGTGLNPRGRYAVHFHRAGINETDGTDPNNPVLKAGPPAEVQDSVVVDSPGWGYVNHTSNVNFVTTNFTYDNVTIRGFGLGIAIPVNGLDIVTGGTFQNKRNFEITTANSQTRTVLLNDKLAGDQVTLASPLTFLPLPKAADEASRINVDLRTSYNPKNRDVSKLFNPDIIRMGTVWLNSFALGIAPSSGPKQLYYYQQAADFKPFPAWDQNGGPINYGGPSKDAFGNVVDYTGIEVPNELLDRSNADLFKTYGLAIGGTVAPAGAVDGRGTFPINGPDGTPSGVSASPRINGLIGPVSTYQVSLDATSARYTKAVDPTYPANTNPQYVFSYRFAKPTPAGNFTNVNVTVKIGNFIAASGYALQLTTLKVNGVPVTVPQPVTPPAQPTQPVLPTGTLTPAQIAANKAATNKYNKDLASYNTYWKDYYNTPVKLSLREGWNIVTGDLEGAGNMRTQLIYGDTVAPDLNLTTPDNYQLRRLTTAANPWTPGTWDSTPQAMTGVALGSTDSTPKTTTVTGQFVAVMNPDDLSFGFDLKGQVVDNSFGHKSFEVFIGNLKSYLNPNDPTAPGRLVPYVSPPTDDKGVALPNYTNVASYQTFQLPDVQGRNQLDRHRPALANDFLCRQRQCGQQQDIRPDDLPRFHRPARRRQR